MEPIQLPNGWRVRIEKVDATLAKQFLESNTNNRHPRAGAIQRYADTMSEGKWLATPNAICFDVNGNMIDGQHRLLAIIRSNTVQELVIYTELPTECFQAFDRGAGRTFAEALKQNKKLSEVARLSARMIHSNNPTDNETLGQCEYYESAHNKLMNECPKFARKLTNASVRLAACFRLMYGNPDYVIDQYSALSRMETSEMTPLVRAFFKRTMTYAAKSGENYIVDTFCLALKVFDDIDADKTRLIAPDTAKTVKAYRNFMRKNSGDLTEESQE